MLVFDPQHLERKLETKRNGRQPQRLQQNRSKGASVKIGSAEKKADQTAGKVVRITIWLSSLSSNSHILAQPVYIADISATTQLSSFLLSFMLRLFSSFLTHTHFLLRSQRSLLGKPQHGLRTCPWQNFVTCKASISPAYQIKNGGFHRNPSQFYTQSTTESVNGGLTSYD